MASKGREISEHDVDAALAEYDLSLQSDPRNTEQLRSRPGGIASMRRAAMREALQAFCNAHSSATN
jgi:hypothetical protein